MATNKDNPKGGSQSSMGNNPDRQFDSQGSKKGSDNQSQRAGNPGRSGSPANSDDDEMSTAGGRQGQFSDKNRANQGQWSPGSGESEGG